jgi:hypothetical protein
MAINSTFVSGAVLTAAQMNNLPMGIVSATSVTASSGVFTAETLRVTSPSFTAVANRFYRITYFEPVLQFNAGTVNNIGMLIRITNIAGAIQTFSEIKIQSSNNNAGTAVIVKTLAAGATVFVGSVIANGGGSGNAFSSATAVTQLVIEDLGST